MQPKGNAPVRPLQSRLDKHFVACAAAAAAVGAVATERANAVVQYSGPINFHIVNTGSPGGQTGVYVDVAALLAGAPAAAVPNFDLNFFAINRTTSGVDNGKKAFSVYAPGTKLVSIVGPFPQYGVASKLAAGASIGPASTFGNGYGQQYTFITYNYADGTPVAFPWVAGSSDGFIGFSFQIAGQTHYGWARLNIGSYQSNLDSFLRDFAYETDANTPILAGAVPEPTAAFALGLLAMGAMGLRSSRKQATGAAQAD
ncbi:MAG TPA: PEP-CTERM sorting domain-containing protein [Tepidisphaeraceae bacterium]|jgi:hypothetical protein